MSSALVQYVRMTCVFSHYSWQDGVNDGVWVKFCYPNFAIINVKATLSNVSACTHSFVFNCMFLSYMDVIHLSSINQNLICHAKVVLSVSYGGVWVECC